MTFEDLKAKYSNRDVAFIKHLPSPNESNLKELIKKYNCKFPKSFIDFQLEYCHKIPMGDFSIEGFGWANVNLEPRLYLGNILKDYSELEYPKFLTPFRYDNGDFWCFDNREPSSEFPVVIFDHNSNDIETDSNYKWTNFIDWLDKTMEEDF